MLFRLIAFVNDVRQIFSDAIALRNSMSRKHGWMSE
jgi:hypothetical protein